MNRSRSEFAANVQLREHAATQQYRSAYVQQNVKRVNHKDKSFILRFLLSFVKK